MALRYDFFDEAYYLQNNPDVDANVNAPGGFFSGIEHFDRFGRFERRVFVSPFYNEDSYLAKYPDVAAAVSAGAFSSGLQHFTEIGYDEGRSPDIGIPDGGEFYLRKYPDVAAAVGAGVYRSWYDHFISAGRFEGRSPTEFNSADYLGVYPDVAAAIADPNNPIESAFEHYLLFGQFEGRSAPFDGTPGNDIVTGFGVGEVDLFGVEYIVLDPNNSFNFTLGSSGRGEIDTLIGSPTAATNRFLLAVISNPFNLPEATQFYVGGGASDYAIMRNFRQGRDSIQLKGSFNDFTQEVSGGNLSIFTRNGRDLVGVVEGVSAPLSFLGLNPFNPAGGTFFIG